MNVQAASQLHFEDLFLWVCRHADQERTIADLEDDALRATHHYLVNLGVETGVPGLIHGLVICEASARFMKQIYATSAEGGEA